MGLRVMKFGRVCLVVGALLLTTCRDPKIDTGSDLGPEVPISKLANAENSVLGKLNPLTIQLGQWRHYENNIRVEIGAVHLLSESELCIIGRQHQDTELTIHFGGRDSTYKDGVRQDGPIYDADDPEVFKVPPPEDVMSTSAQELNPFVVLSSAIRAKEDRYTIHNLQTNELQVWPPKAVQNRPNCGGVPGCVLNAIKVRFDLAIWKADDSYERVHIEEMLSADAPYIASKLYLCESRMVTIEDKKYFARQCEVLKDFIWQAPDLNNFDPARDCWQNRSTSL